MVNLISYPMENERDQTQPASQQFTQHQITIMRIWAEQPGITHIAHKLNLSEHTVQTHLKRMRRKLGVSRTFDVYQYLQRHKLL